MRYHWLRQEAVRKVLDIFWDKGKNNDADYSTKHFGPSHHKEQRPKYILKGFSVSEISSRIVKKLSGEGVLKPYPARM